MAKTRTAEPDYSPSILHGKLMDENPPSMGYDGGDVKTWQTRLSRKLRQLLGDWPTDRCELNVRTLWRREHPLGVIEKIVFTSEPGADVPAYVCLPATAAPPYTWMICVQGHSTGMHNSIAVQRDDNSLPLEVAGDRDFALGCMQRGIAALCIEQRSFGERRELIEPNAERTGCHTAAMHALMLGRTLIGERVYDVDRGVDYLLSRDDGRPGRIGVMGNSGGGTVSLFSAALLKRIAFAMPSCYFCTFRDSIMAMHHCCCNYVPGLLKVAEMADCMGLFAPKPVVIVAGRQDNIFPIAATRRAFKRLKAIYQAAGAADNCKLVVGPEGHRFYAEKAWPTMLKFLKKL